MSFRLGPRARELAWWLALAAIVLLATALRLSGVDRDRPFVYHPDEWAIVKPAMTMVRTGDPNPHRFGYPTFLIYAESGIVDVLARTTGLSLDTSTATAMSGLAAASESDLLPAQYDAVLAGRLLVATLGTLTVLVVAWAARLLARLSGRPPGSAVMAGLVAAACMALARFPVDQSRFLTTDMPGTFWVALVLPAALLGTTRRSVRWLLASGLCAGLAASTKYPMVVVIVVPLLAWILGRLRAHGGGQDGRRPPPFGLAGLAGIVVAAVAGFVVATPAILFDPSAVMAGLAGQVFHYNVAGHPGAQGDSALFYAEYLWSQGAGPVLSVLAAAAVGWACVRPRRLALLALVFPILYAVLVSVPEVRFERNLLPAVPYVAVLVGTFVADAVRSVDGLLRRSPRPVGTWFRWALLASVVALVAGQPVQAAIDDAVRARLPDTRTVALAWAEAALPAGSAIVREEYTPQLASPRFRVGVVPTLSVRDLTWYRAAGFQYAIASDAMYGRFLAPGFPGQRARYEELFALPLVHEERPSADESGPVIRIFRVPSP